MGGRTEFTCELDGCNNQSSMRSHNYKKLVRHYCSGECKTKAKENRTITIECSDNDCTIKRTMPLCKYQGEGIHYCSLSCAGKHKIRRTRIEKMLMRDKDGEREIFRQKWNRMVWK